MTHIKAVIIPADYVTVEEAARIAGVHRSTITMGIHDGRLPAITCESWGSPRGWRFLVRKSDLDNFALLPSRVPAAIEPPRRFGQVLRRLRLRGEWSQRDLAARMGVDHGRISNYENGIYLPSSAYFPVLVEALRCSSSDERELVEAMADEMDYRDRLRASGKPWPRVTHEDGMLKRRAKHAWTDDDSRMLGKDKAA